MRAALLSCVLPTLLAPCLAAQAKPPAQAKPVPAATPDYKDEALVFEHWDTTVRMHPDGTGDRNEHVVLRLQSEGAIRQFGVLAVAYASATAKGSVEHVEVRKPDGTVVTTPESDSIETTPDVTREAPLYSDLKQVQLPVRSLAAGDTLQYDLHTVYTRAEAPNQFWGADRFNLFGVVLSRTFTLQVPSGSYVQVWSPNYKAAVSDDHGTKTYRWTTDQLKPTPKPKEDGEEEPDPVKDLDEDAQGRKLPSIAWTTFHSWAEVGDWYRSLALSRAEPDAAIRERANALTADAKTPVDQVRALYSFVATKTRYVGIDLGIGRFQPHPADDVLSHAYGDCKDKDTLLEALLRAKGFTTAPALIGAGITPVPDVPSPAVFNHVITTVTLPGTGQLWMDSTAEVAPFRLLMPVLRDQEALVIPATSPARLEKTPATPPYPFTADFKADATLSDTGLLKGHMTATYRDDQESLIRALARNVAPAEWDKASQYLVSLTGFTGTTGNTRFPGIADYSTPATLTYDYTRKDYGDWANLRIIPLDPAITIANDTSDTKPPQHDIELGAPRTETVESRIKLPDGWRTDLPSAIHAKSKYATYDKTYHFADGAITSDRTITVLESKVPKADWKQYQAFCKQANLDENPWIQLIRPAAKEAAPKSVPVTRDAAGNSTQQIIITPPPSTAVPAAPEDASLETLQHTVSRQFDAGDLAGARQTLDRIKSKDPSAPYLNYGYGSLAYQNRNFAEAVTFYRKEAELHPEEANAWQSVASSQYQQGNKAEAAQTLQKFFSSHPDNIAVGQQLASIEISTEDYPAALKTLQTMATANPADRRIRLQLANAFLLAHRNDEAAAAAKSVLDGTDDPNMLNDAGYVLAELGQDLPQAEQASRASITKLEEKSRSITPDQVNSAAFHESNLLIASWDTLGWILFREGKLDDARPYLLAAWRNDLHAEVGDHMGQLEEAAGNSATALEFYRLAKAASSEGPSSPAVRTHIDESLARLQKVSALPNKNSAAEADVSTVMANKGLSSGQKKAAVDRLRSNANITGATQQLVALRTYTVPRGKDISGWGTVRLQLTATGVQAAQPSSGEPKLSAEITDLKALHYNELVPPTSTAWLLRSGVLSCPSTGPTCELVLVPNATLATEQH